MKNNLENSLHPKALVFIQQDSAYEHIDVRDQISTGFFFNPKGQGVKKILFFHFKHFSLKKNSKKNFKISKKISKKFLKIFWKNLNFFFILKNWKLKIFFVKAYLCASLDDCSWKFRKKVWLLLSVRPALWSLKNGQLSAKMKNEKIFLSISSVLRLTMHWRIDMFAREYLRMDAVRTADGKVDGIDAEQQSVLPVRGNFPFGTHVKQATLGRGVTERRRKKSHFYQKLCLILWPWTSPGNRKNSRFRRPSRWQTRPRSGSSAPSWYPRRGPQTAGRTRRCAGPRCGPFGRWTANRTTH